MIDGVQVKQLKVHVDERGRLMEILRSDDEIFERFGQAYVTTANPGAVKAWHYHRKQTDHFTCIQGIAKVVLYDSRKKSKTFGEINEFFMGIHNPILVKIPPLVYHGFTSVGPCEAMILNVPTEVYRHKAPDEFRADPYSGEVPYDWSRKDR